MDNYCSVYGYTTLSLSTDGLWVVYTLGLLGIMLLWTFMYRFLCEYNAFSSLGFMPKSSICGSYSNSTL